MFMMTKRFFFFVQKQINIFVLHVSNHALSPVSITEIQIQNSVEESKDLIAGISENTWDGPRLIIV